jgi:hypothetical protein
MSHATESVIAGKNKAGGSLPAMQRMPCRACFSALSERAFWLLCIDVLASKQPADAASLVEWIIHSTCDDESLMVNACQRFGMASA